MVADAREIPGQILRRRVAVLGILGEAPLDDPAQRHRRRGRGRRQGSGSSRMIAVIVSGPVARANAFLPVTIS